MGDLEIPVIINRWETDLFILGDPTFSRLLIVGSHHE
jgi:hypothetical protein